MIDFQEINVGDKLQADFSSVDETLKKKYDGRVCTVIEATPILKPDDFTIVRIFSVKFDDNGERLWVTPFHYSLFKKIIITK